MSTLAFVFSFICIRLLVYLIVYVCSSVYSSVCPSICLWVCPFVFGSVCLSVWLLACLSLCLSVCLFVYLSFCLYPFVHPYPPLTVPVTAGGGGDDGGAVSAADEFGVGAHGRWHDARLRAEGHAVHHAAFRADAGAVAALVHLLAHLVPLALEVAEDFVAFPDGAAFAGLLHLPRVATVDGLHRRRAHRVTFEKAVLANAPLHATILPYFAVLIHFAVVDASEGTWIGAIPAAVGTVAVSAWKESRVHGNGGGDEYDS